MDDKRTIIAMLLVGLIFLLMPAYYELVGVSAPPPEPEPPPEEGRARRDTTTSVPSTPVSPAVSAPAITAARAEEPAAPTPLQDDPERLVTVETPLQRLRFSTRGGVLVSARLEEYTHGDGGPLELIPSGGRALGLTIRSEAGEEELVDLTGWHFEPDRERVMLETHDEGMLRLRAELGGGRWAEKVFLVRGDQYGLQVGVSLHGFSEDSIVRLAWRGGIALAERKPDVDLRSMKAAAYINESLWEVQVDEDEEDSETERGTVQWAGVRNKYFLCALAPESKARHRVALSGRPLVRAPFREYEFTLGTRWGDVEGDAWRLLLYLGPLDLEAVSRYERDFDRAMDLGFPVIRQIATVLLMLFVAAYAIIPNYGWVIVAFGVIVKILVYPLTHKSYESAARMQELQPKIAALRRSTRTTTRS